MHFQHIRLELGPQTTLALNRPDKRNAMVAPMGKEIARAVGLINERKDARVVLVRGEGRSFCAGGDLGFIGDRTSKEHEENRKAMLDFYRSFLSILSVRVPTVAVLHGAAVGAGMCFAIACDLRLAAEEAKLGFNFVRVGLHPGMGATELLPRLVGPAVAADLLLSGRLLTGTEAARVGLVNAAVPAEALPKLVDERVAALLAGAPIAIAQTKASLLAALHDPLEAALQREARAQAVGYGTADLLEGVAAFSQKRTPAFRGE